VYIQLELAQVVRVQVPLNISFALET